MQADVSKPEDCGKLFEAADRLFGGIDIVVANAGIQRDAAFTEMSLDDWRKVIDVNLTGQSLRAGGGTALPPARARFGPLAGTWQDQLHELRTPGDPLGEACQLRGRQGRPETADGDDGAGARLREDPVNAIAPGAIKTDINRDGWESEEARRELLKLIPYGRVGDPKDVGEAAVWLASDASDYVIGTTLFVDGGMSIPASERAAGRWSPRSLWPRSTRCRSASRPSRWANVLAITPEDTPQLVIIGVVSRGSSWRSGRTSCGLL